MDERPEITVEQVVAAFEDCGRTTGFAVEVTVDDRELGDMATVWVALTDGEFTGKGWTPMRCFRLSGFPTVDEVLAFYVWFSVRQAWDEVGRRKIRAWETSHGLH